MSSITVRLGCRIAAFLLLMGCSGSAENSEKQAAQNSTQQTGTATMPTTGTTSAQPSLTEDLSVIWIVASPDCELILTDSENRRTSYDLRTDQSLQEIPNSSGLNEYIEDPQGEGGMGSNQIVINRPANGNYLLTVTGTRDGAYELSIVAYNAAGEQSAWTQAGIAIAANTTNGYKLSFDKTSPTAGLISGGFEGAAQPGELNELLTYGTVSGNVTALPAETSSFALLVFYGPTLVPDMFSATLNDADVSNLFKPVPGRHEIVGIPLHAGRNVLRLGAMGATETDKTLDEDVLEFVVE